MNRVSSYRRRSQHLPAGAESLNKIVDRDEKHKQFPFRSPVQWLGPHLLAESPRGYPRGGLSKPNWTIGRAQLRESQIPDWQEKLTRKRSIRWCSGLQRGDWANNPMRHLETPAGVS